MSYDNFISVFGKDFALDSTNIVLRKYGNTVMKMAGQVNVKVNHKGILKKLILLVVHDKGPSLLGRDWLQALGLVSFQDSAVQLSSVNKISLVQQQVNTLLSKFHEVFLPGLGTFNEEPVHIDIIPNANPSFYKARPVPYALLPKVTVEIDRLVSEGILQPVKYSKWACPVVPVMKKDGNVRLCGDYKLTVNKVINLEQYPIPKVNELLSKLAGGKYFAKLDMSQAYNQLVLHADSRPLTTINTHKGLFEYTRLSFGISSAPAIFQRTMENLLKNVSFCVSFFDDILISGSNMSDFLSNLSNVLKILQEKGLRLNKDKCTWCSEEILYLGFKINSTGLYPDEDKKEAITKAPTPKNVKELQAFLGLLNFYRAFLPRAATILEPLNRLLKKDTPWKWNSEQDNSFQAAKDTLLSSDCLVHFNPSLPIVVSADASSYGVGAVLALMIDGKERPVCFASRTLMPAERRYSQLEKEALALVFALKKFHFYVYGMKFTLKTDHKPLLGLFSSSKPIPVVASGRIQRWCLTMQAYHFNLVHTSGIHLGNVDALSRLPLPTENESVPIPAEWINLVNFFSDQTPLEASAIAKFTAKDVFLSKIVAYVNLGWPDKVNKEFQPFHSRKEELSLQSGCILLGNRVIIPKFLQASLLKELHSGHTGATRMKQLARSYFWWPKLDEQIEHMVNSCDHCLSNRTNPAKSVLHPWEWAEKPWFRIHVDYAGPFRGLYFLVVVDSHSKWVEIFPTSTITSTATIKLLRSCFARFGFPAVLVSDNGPSFVSKKFSDFLKSISVRHVTSSIYKPSTNGLAERMVASFKRGVSHSIGEEDLRNNLDDFLLTYRVTPHATTGVSPAQLMFGRSLRNSFDLLHPLSAVQKRVQVKQELQKSSTLNNRKLNIDKGDPVMIRMFSGPNKWRHAEVVRSTGPVSARCVDADGIEHRRHHDQIIKREYPTSVLQEEICDPATEDVSEPACPTNESISDPPSVPIRKSSRQVKPPVRLNL